MEPKNYLIIGGTSGIGAALAEALSKEGHQLFIVSRSEAPDLPEGAKYLKADILDLQIDLSSFLPEVLHGMAYCPGSINLRSFKALKPADFEEEFRINVSGAVTAIKAALRPMQKAGQASVVMFSTVAVQTGLPFHASIAASKGAVEGLTRSLAAEFAPGIRFNAIAPSLTDTPLAARLLNDDAKREGAAQRNPMKRFGLPNDIAQAALFLLSENSSWVTGQVLHVDGGYGALKV
ncbi:MAG: SDR family oxidoreductase [Bacteroidales bacterium]|nr:SDR family oxidoreductase [Bacteroidales bacterium]